MMLIFFNKNSFYDSLQRKYRANVRPRLSQFALKTKIHILAYFNIYKIENANIFISTIMMLNFMQSPRPN